MGPSAKQSVANRHALASLPWTTDEYKELKAQFENLASVPNYPGAYIVDRYTNFAFVNAYTANEDPATAMLSLAVAEAEKTAVLEAAIVALETANASLAANNESLTQKNAKLSKQVKALQNRPEFDAESFFAGMTPAHIFFEIGKATLDARQLAQLDFLAKNIIATDKAPVGTYVAGVEKSAISLNFLLPVNA